MPQDPFLGESSDGLLAVSWDVTADGGKAADVLNRL
jgi:hypothetical protein